METQQSAPSSYLTGYDNGSSATNSSKGRRVLKVGDRVRLACREFEVLMHGPGTVIAVPSKLARAAWGHGLTGWVDVRWDTGYVDSYCMGWNDQYDLELL